MTSHEFEDFLYSIGGLVNGNSKDKEIITTNLCECSEGWLELISNLIAELIATGWDKEVCQIKEKLGGLRFYTNEASESLTAIITTYEQSSFNICEICGSTKNVQLRNGKRLRSLCENHK